MGNKIVVMQESKAMQRISSPDWLKAVGDQLLVAASMLSKDLTKDEVVKWKQLLSPYPKEAIEWAFDQYIRKAEFFPFPVNILELCETWGKEHDITQSAAYRTRMELEQDGKK